MTCVPSGRKPSKRPPRGVVKVLYNGSIAFSAAVLFDAAYSIKPAAVLLTIVFPCAATLPFLASVKLICFPLDSVSMALLLPGFIWI